MIQLTRKYATTYFCTACWPSLGERNSLASSSLGEGDTTHTHVSCVVDLRAFHRWLPLCSQNHCSFLKVRGLTSQWQCDGQNSYVHRADSLYLTDLWLWHFSAIRKCAVLTHKQVICVIPRLLTQSPWLREFISSGNPIQNFRDCM